MKGQKTYYQALVKLLYGYALLTGIIGAIFFFFLFFQKSHSPSQPASQSAHNDSRETSGKSDAVGSPTSTTDKFCGGIAGIQCPPNYTCKLNGNYPDAGGACVKKENQTTCTMVAKLCPDGSYVGRSGPNCEFAPCPKGI